MSWKPGWHLLYNVVAPAVTLGSIGWSLHYLRSPERRDRHAARFLLVCSITGMLLLFKWVNRSLENLWWMNGMIVLVVLFWWMQTGALALGESLQVRLGPWLARAGRADLPIRTWTSIGVAIVLICLALVASYFHSPNGQVPGRSSSPLVRIGRFFSDTPTVVNRLALKLRQKPLQALYEAAPFPVLADDVALIREHTKPAEPAAILAMYDWLYVAEAHRPPQFSWVPVYFAHSRFQFERLGQDIHRTDQVFVQKNSLTYLKAWSPQLYQEIVPYLLAEFVRVDSSTNLDCYRRKP
jgi:hypothetical protein